MKVYSSFNQNLTFKNLFHNPLNFFSNLKLKNKDVVKEIFNINKEFSINWYLNARSALFDYLIEIKSKEPNKDIVILPVHTCIVLVNAVLKAGLKVKFVDTKKNSFNYNPESFEGNFNSKVLAVIIPANFGEDFDKSLVDKYKKKTNLILDLANSIQKFNFSDFSAVLLSFGSNKILDASVGGAIITHEKFSYSKKVKRLFKFSSDWYFFKTFNFLLLRKFVSNIFVKIYFQILKSLHLFPNIVSKNEKDLKFQKVKFYKSNQYLLLSINRTLKNYQKIYEFNQQVFSKLKFRLSKDILPEKVNNCMTAFFPVFVNDPQKLYQEALNQKIVLSKDWSDSLIVPSSCHLPDDFLQRDQYPNALQNSRKLILIPINFSVDPEDLETIIKLISKYKNENRI